MLTNAVSSTPAFMNARVIWFAMILSNPLFAFVSWNIVSQRPEEEVIPFFKYSLTPMMGGIAVLILLLGYYMTYRTMDYYRATTPKLPESQIPSQAMSNFMVPFVVRMAICEAVALFGLVITLSTGDMWGVAIFAAVAMLQQVWFFPTAKRVLAWSGVQVPTQLPT